MVKELWHKFTTGLPVTPEEWVWLSFGMVGNFVFGSRFFVQWLYSEKYKESRIPEAFWWLSVLGTFILLVYFLHKREVVGILGSGPNLVPYLRNLVLIYRKKRRDREGFEVIMPKTPADGPGDAPPSA
jgi:lipid-A-disaccharide synthase-like uncharacterized protein